MAEIIYKKLALLNRESGKNRKILPTETYAYAGGLNSVYLAGAEFVEACKDYPIFFTQADDAIVPVAMLGLREGENLFVEAAGAWDAAYVPAYVRRYPFILTKLQGQDNMGVCIDESYAGLSETQGEPLFDEQGNNTPFLDTAVNFLHDYQTEALRTERFCQRLVKLDLLMQMNAKADISDGSSFVVNGLMAIDERRLLALPENDSNELFRLGELSWIYAHLVSLSNVNRLVNKLAARRFAEAKAAKAAEIVITKT